MYWVRALLITPKQLIWQWFLFLLLFPQAPHYCALKLIQHGVYNAQLEWMWAGICSCQPRTKGAVAKDILSVDNHLCSHFSMLSKNLLPGSLTNSSICYTQSIYHQRHKKTVFANKSSNATVICSVFPYSWFPTLLLHRSTTVLKAT